MALTITFVLRDFAEWTSIPGPIQIVYALNSFIRFLWVIIWLSLFGVFVYEFYLIIDRVTKLESQIDLSFNYQSVKFPVVTICNQNPYKLNEIYNNQEFKTIADLLSNYKRVVASGFKDISHDQFFFNKASTQYQKELLAKQLLIILTNSINKTALQKATYSFEELIQYCSFNNIQCSKDNFTSYFDLSYGSCYQFNALNNTKFETLRAGNSFGLKLIITVMQETPEGKKLYLPTTKLAGVQVSLDYKNKYSCIDFFGSHLSVGQKIQILIKLLKTKLMKPPYGKCIDNMPYSVYNLYSNNTYTLKNCLRSCYQQKTINICNCADPKYKKINDTIPYCNLSNVDCLINLNTPQFLKKNNDKLHNCDCKPPCKEYMIKTQISMLSLPKIYKKKKTKIEAQTLQPLWQNFNFLLQKQYFFTNNITNKYNINKKLLNLQQLSENNIKKNFDQSISSQNLKAKSDDNIKSIYMDYTCSQNKILTIFKNNITRCFEWFENNALVLDVNSKGLDVELYTQRGSYSISQASNDLGGQVSLWLGASIISVIEIITLIIMIILFFTYGRNVSVTPTDEEFNQDLRYKHIQEFKSELDIHERNDKELFMRIKHQKENEKKQQIEFNQKINEAYTLWTQASEKLSVANKKLTQSPLSIQAQAFALNAKAIEQATANHLQLLYDERKF